VHSKSDMRPARWRQELGKIDRAAFELTSWITREGDWYVLHAVADKAEELRDRLKPLRQRQFTVEIFGWDNDEGPKNGVCTNFMRGRACAHAPPCK